MARSYAQLFTALRSAAVKALLTGTPPGAEEWSKVVSALIGDLVAGPDATLNRLVSLESKVDDLIQRQFIGPLETARYQLGYALETHRSRKDRRRLLEAARNSLLEALPHAPDLLDRAHVHWSLAMVWLAAESVEDCRNELSRAGNIDFHVMTWGLGWIRHPPADSVDEFVKINGMSAWERLAKEIGLGGDGPRLRARAAMSKYAFDEMVKAQAALAVVQRARRELGVPASRCLIPTIATGQRIRQPYLPAITVRGLPGTNSIGGLTVTVDRAVAVRRRLQATDALDAHVTLNAWADGRVVGFQPLRDWTLDAIDLVGQRGRAAAPVASRAMLTLGSGAELGLAALGGRSVLGAPSPDRVVVPAESTVKGWIRADARRPARGSVGQSAAESPVVGLRVAFGPRAPGDVAGPWTIDLMLPVAVEPPKFAPSKSSAVVVRRLAPRTRPTAPTRLTRPTRPRPRPR